MITVENYDYELKLNSNVEGIQSYIIREAAKIINPCSVLGLCKQIEDTANFIEENNLNPLTRYFGVRKQCITKMHKGDVCTDEEFQEFENVMYQIKISDKMHIELNEMTVKEVKKERRYDVRQFECSTEIRIRGSIVVPHDSCLDVGDYILENYREEIYDLLQDEFDYNSQLEFDDWSDREDYTSEQINNAAYNHDPINLDDFEEKLESEFFDDEEE